MTREEIIKKSICRLNFYNKFNIKFNLLLGTPLHTNIGDRAIAYAEHVYLRSRNRFKPTIEFPHDFDLDCMPSISEDIVIYLHGGGNFGDIWLNEEVYRRKIVKKFTKNPIIMFPQTLFFNSSKNLEESISAYSEHNNLQLTAREKTSYDLMREEFKINRIVLTPDIVMFLKVRLRGLHRQRRAIFSVRQDKEKTIGDDTISKLEGLVRQRFGMNDVIYSDMHTSEGQAMNPHKNIVMNKLREYRSASIVVTDRLHGMIFALLTGTPCIVLGSQTYKTSGVFEWIKQYPEQSNIMFCDSSKAALEAVEIIDINKKIQPYNPIKYSKLWDRLAMSGRDD